MYCDKFQYTHGTYRIGAKVKVISGINKGSKGIITWIIGRKYLVRLAPDHSVWFGREEITRAVGVHSHKHIKTDALVTLPDN